MSKLQIQVKTSVLPSSHHLSRLDDGGGDVAAEGGDAPQHCKVIHSKEVSFKNQLLEILHRHAMPCQRGFREETSAEVTQHSPCQVTGCSVWPEERGSLVTAPESVTSTIRGQSTLLLLKLESSSQLHTQSGS